MLISSIILIQTSFLHYQLSKLPLLTRSSKRVKAVRYNPTLHLSNFQENLKQVERNLYQILSSVALVMDQLSEKLLHSPKKRKKVLPRRKLKLKRRQHLKLFPQKVNLSHSFGMTPTLGLIQIRCSSFMLTMSNMPVLQL